jgi:hypothetical protein
MGPPPCNSFCAVAAAFANTWLFLLAAVLSARLGLGKGGLSWGSPELLAESLQVSSGFHQVYQ